MKKIIKLSYIIVCTLLTFTSCDIKEALEKPLVDTSALSPQSIASEKNNVPAEAESSTPAPVAETTVPQKEVSTTQPSQTVEASPSPIPSPEPTPPPEVTPSPTPSPEPVVMPAPSPTPESSPSPEPVPSAPQTLVKRQVTIPEVSGYPAHNFSSPYTEGGALTNKKNGWYFNRNKEHVPPTATRDFDIRQFDGHYLGDTSRKVIYLTFDEGYENGYTEKILDVLLEKQVTAAFFVTKPYILSEPELIQRMVDEGHIVGNHSVSHKSFPDLSDEDIEWELAETARAFKEVTGQDMPLFFRPPMGEYSARTLAVTMNTGYKSIFWSFAYKDWETYNQPGKAVAYETIMNDLHNGQIALLHAVSSSNTEALPDIIDSFREHGYEFLSLYDLP